MDYTLGFARPEYLGLLLLLPLVGWIGRGSLRGLGRLRAISALLLRMAVAVGIIFALAEVEFVRRHKQLTVLFLVDQSLSIADADSRASLAYVEAAIREQLDRSRADRAGVIAFGREANIEWPPLADAIPTHLRIETPVDGQSTDLAKALRLAAATFPEQGAKRVVIISDGNENLGDARAEAARLADTGIGIDVLPIVGQASSDVAIERVAIPANIRQGEPFDVRIVVGAHNLESQRGTTGQLRLLRHAAGEATVLSEQQLQLSAGQQVYSVRERLDLADFYTYEAQFIPDDPSVDRYRQNNRASTAAQIRGRGRLLVIADHSRLGESAELVERLKMLEFEVDVAPSSNPFASLADLQRYDAVLLNDVPRVSGEGPHEMTDFSDRHISMLVRNTRELGAGLIMLGGPNSFGAGGWANTELEQAMPVDFQIKNLKVVPSGALMLVIDRSGSMADQKLELGKAAAIAATRILGPQDYIGVVTFDGAADWAVTMQQVGDPDRIASRISRIGIGGGTYLWPAMLEGFAALRRAPASAKHMIILTDGRTQEGDYLAIARRMRAQKITVTCVAIGQDADDQLLSNIALAGGGKFYHVDRPTSIPRIFMKEAFRVARPLIFEDPAGFQPQVSTSHEILSGCSDAIPPLTGFVMTTLKQNPLVEAPLCSPKPGGQSATLLSTWTYGLGRTVAWTSDLGQRWATAWTNWSHFDRFLAQMVRWSLRPSDGTERYTLVTKVSGDQLEVVVTAMDQGAFLNFLEMTGSVVDPEMGSRSLKLAQVAPGRYRGTTTVDRAGTYFVNVAPGGTAAPLRTALTVPYSDEFVSREPNTPLLRELAALAPRYGTAGAVIESPAGLADLPRLLQTNVFRAGLQVARTRSGGWHLFVLATALLFLVDIANRRVQLDLRPLAGLRFITARRKERAAVTVSPAIARLKSAKAAVGSQIDALQSSVSGIEPLHTTSQPLPERRESSPSPQPAPPELHPPSDEGSYTKRLLRAKQGVWIEHAHRANDGTKGSA